jgi:hypothetical protein
MRALIFHLADDGEIQGDLRFTSQGFLSKPKISAALALPQPLKLIMLSRAAKIFKPFFPSQFRTGGPTTGR